MTPADTDLLARLDVLASTTPCTIPKADALRLVDLCGLRDMQVWRDIEGQADPVLVLPAAIRQMIDRVRTGKWPGVDKR